MINILFNGQRVTATDEGIFEPLSYWTQETIDAITQAYNDGNYEVIPEQELVPEADWLGFSVAIFANSGWQNWHIPSDLRIALISAAVNSNLSAFNEAFAMALIFVPPSEEMLLEWREIGSQYGIEL